MRFDARQLIVGVIDSAWRGVDLAEVVDGKAAGAQDRDPLPVAGMELRPAASPVTRRYVSHCGRSSSRQAGAGRFRRAQGDQDARGVEHQPPSCPQQPSGFRDPADRVAPQARPALRHGQIEAARRQRDIARVRLDEREEDTGSLLAAPGRLKLGGVTSTRSAGSPPGQPGGEVRRPAAELDHVQAADVAEHAELLLGHVEDAPVISPASQAQR